VDLGKLDTGDWLMVGGGAAMFVFGLALDWTTIDTARGTRSIDDPFDYFFTGGLAWFLVVGLGVLALLRVLGKLPADRQWTLILLAMGTAATVLMVVRLLLGDRVETEISAVDGSGRGLGMWAALVWALVATVGASLAHTAAGGDLKDLTDITKLKAAVRGEDDPPPAAPPPPPASPPSPAPPSMPPPPAPPRD
jgi:hypothetical protein